MFEINLVLHEIGKRHFWQGTGALSIKSFSGGKAYYDVGCGRHCVDDSSYLVLNSGQPYSITIDSKTELESFCVFFRDGFVEEVHQTLTLGTDRLLENSGERGTPHLHFVEKNYPNEEILSPALQRLKVSFFHGSSDPLWLEEQFHELAKRVLRVHQIVRQEIEELPAVRAATREELYRRVYRARDYLYACFSQNISLEDLGKIACLSTNHLLKTFREVFRKTPHQFLMALRMEQARILLAETELPVTDICFAVGFESLGSFSWLFHRQVGMSPQRYRSAYRLPKRSKNSISSRVSS